MRYELIDNFDCVFYDSNSIKECEEVAELFGVKKFRGIYDSEENEYIKRFN